MENRELISFGDMPVHELMREAAITDDALIESLMDDDDLNHSGIKGMRWGVRRYQNKDGSLTPAGKKRYDKEMEKVKAETRKIKNQQRTAAKLDKLEAAKQNLKALKKGGKDKKGDKESSPEEDIETKKARILESRSAKQLYDNANLFSYNELQAAKLRLDLERSIKQLEPPTVDKGKQFASKFTDTADTVANIVQSGTKAYNGLAKVYNAFVGNKKGSSLPLINDSTSSKLDKFKEETEWMKAKNERKKAVDESTPKEKTKLEKLREETAWIDAENKNREAKRASRRHDESDAKEAAKEASKKTQQDAWGEPEQTGSADRSSQYRSGSKSSEKSTVYTVSPDDVIGEGTSRRSSSSKTPKSYVDAEWTEVTPASSVPAEYRTAGQSYVSGFLGDGSDNND